MKLNFKTKFSYGLIGIGDAASYSFVGGFLLFFLITIAGINPGIAGTIAAIGAVWDTISSTFVGYISDGVNTRFGKRKPFLLISSFPLAIFMSLLFTAVEASGLARIAYYVVMLMLFWTFFSLFFIPYLAWGAELVRDYHERTVIRAYTSFFNLVGISIGIVLPVIIVDTLMGWGNSASQSWLYTGMFCGAVSALTIFFGALGIKDKHEIEYSEKKSKHLSIPDMLRNYREIIKLRTVKFIIAASVFYLIGYAVFFANRIYFLTYNAGLPAPHIAAVIFMMTFTSAMFVPVITALNKRFDKKDIFIFGLGISVSGMIVFGLVSATSLQALILFALAYCLGGMCYWQLMPAMIYDVCEVDQLANNKERAGLVISLQSLAESVSNAAGLQLLGIILQFAGFNEGAEVQAANTLTWISLSFSIIPAAFMGLAIVMIIKYPITKKTHNRVLDALDRRNGGEAIDMTEFKNLI